MANKTMTPEEFQAAFNEMLTSYAGSNEMKRKDALQLLSGGLGLAGGLVDTGISRNQVNEANRLQAGLKKPSIYSPSRDRDLLQSRIADAQRRSGDVKEDLAPAELANLDAYLKDIGNARIASGGQAGLFGSMANASALRRRRGGLETAALGAGLKRQARQDLDGLTALDLQDQRSFDRSKQIETGQRLDQYNREASEAAALGSAGRLNMRNSIQGLLPQIYNMTSTLSDVGKNWNWPDRTQPQIEPIDFGENQGNSMDIIDTFNRELDNGFMRFQDNPYSNLV